jgi:hypothetical protein
VPITDFEFDGVAGPGHIGLQVHGVKKPELVGKKVRFRNIYLKEVQSVEEQVEDDEAVSHHGIASENRTGSLSLSRYFEG